MQLVFVVDLVPTTVLSPPISPRSLCRFPGVSDADSCVDSKHDSGISSSRVCLFFLFLTYCPGQDSQVHEVGWWLHTQALFPAWIVVPHEARCLLVVGVTQMPFVRVRKFPSSLLEFSSRMSAVFRHVLCLHPLICSCDFSSLDTQCGDIHWLIFLNTEPAIHSQDKLHLVVVHCFLYISLDFICWHSQVSLFVDFVFAILPTNLRSFL